MTSIYYRGYEIAITRYFYHTNIYKDSRPVFGGVNLSTEHNGVVSNGLNKAVKIIDKYLDTVVA